MSKLLALIILPLPSVLKVIVLKLLGHEIHRSAYIGFSYLNVKNISLAKNTYIGLGNIFTNLETLEMHAGSRINRWNRFTSNLSFHGKVRLLKHASISLRHYFDVCDLVELGANTIVAGHDSTFFTHSKGVITIDYVKPIIVGSWCYLGSNLCVAPGAKIGNHCFVGMGSVLVGDMSSYSFSLIAGNPAKIKKKLPKDANYFIQGDIAHPHLRKK